MLENEFHSEHEGFIDIIDKINLCYKYISNGELHFNIDFIEDTIEDCLYEELIIEGIELSEIVLEHYPNNTEIMILQGRLLNANHEYQLAIEKLLTVLNITNSSEVYTYLAESYLGIGDNEKTKLYLDLAFEYEKNDPAIFDLYGRYYKNIGNYKKAIDYFKKSIELNVFYQKNYFEIAYCYERLGQKELAASYYSQFLEYDSLSHIAWYNYGILLHDLQQYDKALVAYDYALQIDDMFADAWYNKGITFIHMGYYEEALECFNQAQFIDNFDEDVLFNLGKVHELLKNYENAINAYNKLLELSPDSPDALLSRASCYISNLKFHLAERDILYVYENFENKKVNALILLGELYSTIGNTKKSIEYYEKALELASNNNKSDLIIDINIALINLYIYEYKVNKALTLLVDTLKLDQKNSECFYILSKIYAIVGRYDLSVSMEEQAMNLDIELEDIYMDDYPFKKITKIFSNKILSN